VPSLEIFIAYIGILTFYLSCTTVTLSSEEVDETSGDLFGDFSKLDVKIGA